MFRRAWPMAVILMLASGCTGRDSAAARVQRVVFGGGPRPDEAPQMLNTELPFRYPAALYARKVQGNVTLRLFVDTEGRVVPDSTRVEDSSGNVTLDSAALAGSRQLHFVPAKVRGEPVAVPILFPVFYRHPEAPPLAGDTILKSLDGADGVS